MSSRLSVQKPYVVATLPRSIDSSPSQYFAAEVYGASPGTKKRKRSELAVGINGEGVNLYDISTSKLITSYALPPQSSLSCPPCSLRTRVSKSKVERRTYVSTRGSEPQITLFYELTEGIAPPDLNTTTHKLVNSASPIVYLGNITSATPANISDLLVVQENGEIRCYGGSDLTERWVSPPTALGRDTASSFEAAKVEFAQLTNAFSASQGILKARQDVFAIFPQEIAEDGFNPEILVLITKSGQDGNTRTLHIVSLPRRSSITPLPSHSHSVEPLLTTRIPSVVSNRGVSRNASFSIQASTGILHQLDDEILTTFDLNDTLPKQQSSFRTTGGQSFLRLTSTSIMVSSSHSITIYNPKYHSTLASVEFETQTPPDSQGQKRKRGDDIPMGSNSAHSCKVITYFPKLGSAVAIFNNQLVGIQLEGQQDKQGKLRATGLLIDSIGCSVKDHIRPFRTGKKSKLTESLTLEAPVPGSHIHGQKFTKGTAEFDDIFSHGRMDPETFDKNIASCLGTEWPTTANASISNGVNSKNDERKNSTSLPKISQIDARWVGYALSKIFTWSEDENGKFRLTIEFYPPHTFKWLIESGQITVSNVETALRDYSSMKTPLPTGQLVEALVEVDRDMDLLLRLVAKNHLDTPELLHAIRRLMQSLGLLGEDPATKQRLLTNGEEEDENDGKTDEDIERLEAEIEKDLELAEYQLGPGSGIRGEALSIALSKLYKFPNYTVVHALQTTFTSQEVVCLIYLLRFELAKGAWTTRYTDVDEDELIDEDAPENAIIFLTTLLSNCIDAIGAGGWLSGEARLVDGDRFEAEELITSLKLEVSAALEGINEAIYLRGITSEYVRYGCEVNAAVPQPTKRKDAPITLRSADQDLSVLPMGLKAEKQISLLKVGVGGAIHKRTMRDIGHQKSQKVGKYTREKIVV